MYKVSPFGYFGRTGKVSQGPWFKEHFVEDDGLEYFYVYNDGTANQSLLSNNIPIEDRTRFDNLYKGYLRAKKYAFYGGLWLGLETVVRVPYF